LTCSTYEETRNVFNIFIGNLKGGDDLEDPGIDGNSTVINFKDMGCEDMKWI
jgi:hypothetical protein